MANENLSARFYHHGEIESEEAAFEEEPVLIIASFLKSFDSQGKQTFEVPPHVMEALAARLTTFWDGATLDNAFGGKTSQKRNTFIRNGNRWGVHWDVHREQENAKALPREKRGRSTPTEIALESVAEARGMKSETIRDLHFRK